MRWNPETTQMQCGWLVRMMSSYRAWKAGENVTLPVSVPRFALPPSRHRLCDAQTQI